MKRHREEVLVPSILALIILILLFLRLYYNKRADAEFVGVLSGVFLGQIGVHIYVISSICEKYGKVSQVYYLVSTFGVIFISALFSKYFSFGYFGGFGLIVGFGHSLIALTRHLKDGKETKSNEVVKK
jgi:hypothetical protein